MKKVSNFLKAADQYSSFFERELRNKEPNALKLYEVLKKHQVPVQDLIDHDRSVMQVLMGILRETDTNTNLYKDLEKSIKKFKNYKPPKDVYTDKDMRNIVRFIPTGSKVETNLSGQRLKINVASRTSAPPLIAEDVPRAAARLQKDVNSFAKEATDRAKGMSSDFETYVHLVGETNAIVFHYTFTLTMKDKKSRHLQQLEQGLKKYA